MIDTLPDMAGGTEAVTIKFGLKFSANAKLVIASAAGEVSIEVQIRWAGPRQDS